MTYEILINTISEIVANTNIEKKGLVLTYNLDPAIHDAMNYAIYVRIPYKTHEFKQTDMFEVEIDGILIKFIKVLTSEK